MQRRHSPLMAEWPWCHGGKHPGESAASAEEVAVISQDQQCICNALRWAENSRCVVKALSKHHTLQGPHTAPLEVLSGHDKRLAQHLKDAPRR